MYTYSVSSQYLQDILSHVLGLGINILSINMENNVYTMILDQEFDEIQYSHLQEFTDLELII